VLRVDFCCGFPELGSPSSSARSLHFFIYAIVSSPKRGSFTFSFPVWGLFLPFSCVSVLARPSRPTLNDSGGREARNLPPSGAMTAVAFCPFLLSICSLVRVFNCKRVLCLVDFFLCFLRWSCVFSLLHWYLYKIACINYDINYNNKIYWLIFVSYWTVPSHLFGHCCILGIKCLPKAHMWLPEWLYWRWWHL
jgi:hypothetical protein